MNETEQKTKWQVYVVQRQVKTVVFENIVADSKGEAAEIVQSMLNEGDYDNNPEVDCEDDWDFDEEISSIEAQEIAK